MIVNKSISPPPFLQQARNAEVRSNAALLFVDAFPILDPHFSKEDTDNEIQRQFDELFVSSLCLIYLLFLSIRLVT